MTPWACYHMYSHMTHAKIQPLIPPPETTCVTGHTTRRRLSLAAQTPDLAHARLPRHAHAPSLMLVGHTSTVWARVRRVCGRTPAFQHSHADACTQHTCTHAHRTQLARMRLTRACKHTTIAGQTQSTRTRHREKKREGARTRARTRQCIPMPSRHAVNLLTASALVSASAVLSVVDTYANFTSPRATRSRAK